MQPARRGDMHRPEAALVVRDLGRERAFQRIGRVGMRVVQDDVDAARAVRAELPAQST